MQARGWGGRQPASVWCCCRCGHVQAHQAAAPGLFLGATGASSSLYASPPAARRDVGVGAGQRARGGRGAALSARSAGGGAAGRRLLWHAGGGTGEAGLACLLAALRVACGGRAGRARNGRAKPPMHAHGPPVAPPTAAARLPTSLPCPALPCPAQMVLGITLLFTVLHLLYVGTNVYSGTAVAGRVAGMTDADVPLLMVRLASAGAGWQAAGGAGGWVAHSVHRWLRAAASAGACALTALPCRAPQVGFGFGASFVALFAQLGALLRLAHGACQGCRRCFLRCSTGLVSLPVLPARNRHPPAPRRRRHLHQSSGCGGGLSWEGGGRHTGGRPQVGVWLQLVFSPAAPRSQHRYAAPF